MGCGSMGRRRGTAFGTRALNPVALAELSPTEFFACLLIDHPGGYRFLPGISPYSCGVVSAPGFEIAHITFRHPVPYRTWVRFDRAAPQRFTDVPKLLFVGSNYDRLVLSPSVALPSSTLEYSKILEDWGLFVDGINPVARTNVAPEVDPPSEPVLFGFSYTRPCDPLLSHQPSWSPALGNCPRESWLTRRSSELGIHPPRR